MNPKHITRDTQGWWLINSMSNSTFTYLWDRYRCKICFFFKFHPQAWIVIMSVRPGMQSQQFFRFYSIIDYRWATVLTKILETATHLLWTCTLWLLQHERGMHWQPPLPLQLSNLEQFKTEMFSFLQCSNTSPAPVTQAIQPIQTYMLCI